MEMTSTATATATAAVTGALPQRAAATTAAGAGALEFLDELMAAAGVDGLVAALTSPSLRRSVDDHAAQVRTLLAARGLDVSAGALAGYASLVLIAAQDCGRRLPADPGGYDWESAEWYLVRLLAVCALAVEL
jgi:hypothetical protein